MVDGRVVERPRGGHMFFKLNTLILLIKLGQAGDREGPLGGK
jgi:hypothetical protein